MCAGGLVLIWLTLGVLNLSVPGDSSRLCVSRAHQFLGKSRNLPSQLILLPSSPCCLLVNVSPSKPVDKASIKVIHAFSCGMASYKVECLIMGKREQPDSEIIDFNSSASLLVCCLVEHSCDHGGPRSVGTQVLEWEAIEGGMGTWRASHREAQSWASS